MQSMWLTFVRLSVNPQTITAQSSSQLPNTCLQDYLRRFNFMAGPDDDPDSPLAQVQGHNLTEGVLAFQQFFGLPVTGKLDDVTLTLMEMPRCGNKDIERPEDLKRRRKRYAIHGKK